jgi:hypothetical protein
MAGKVLIISIVILFIVLVGVVLFSMNDNEDNGEDDDRGCGSALAYNQVTILFDGGPVEGQYYWFDTIDNWVNVQRIEDGKVEAVISEDDINLDTSLKIVKIFRLGKRGEFGPAEDEFFGATRTDAYGNVWTKTDEVVSVSIDSEGNEFSNYAWKSDTVEGSTYGNAVIDKMPGGIDYDEYLSHDDEFDINWEINNDPNYERLKSEITKERILNAVSRYSAKEPEYYEIENVFNTEVFNLHEIVVVLKSGEIVSSSSMYDEDLWSPCY